MTNAQFDQIQPLYSKVNNVILKQLEKDKIEIKEYLEFFLIKIAHYHKLHKSIITLKSNFSNSKMFNSNLQRLKNSIKSIEKEIFEFVNKGESPYIYLMSPFYVFGEGIDFVNEPTISKFVGYKQYFGTGTINFNLSAMFANYKLGYYNPVDHIIQPKDETNCIDHFAQVMLDLDFIRN